MIKVLTDLHCHSVASTHAFCTVTELASEAAEKGLEAIALTDHGPEAPDSPHPWHFESLWMVPRVLKGVTVLRGVEANILNDEGECDLLSTPYGALDIVIASIHSGCYRPKDEKAHTGAWLSVMEREEVDILGHTARNIVGLDAEAVVRTAACKGKWIEINESCFGYSKYGAREKYREILEYAKKYETGIVVNSDAHFSSQLGEFGRALELLEELNFPEELVMNRDLKHLCAAKRKLSRLAIEA